MADNKNDKPSAQDASINDSGELLKSLFGEELEVLRLDGKGKPAEKKDKKTSGIQKPKSPSQVKGDDGKKAEHQIATEEKKIVKSYPVSQDQVSTLRKAGSKEDTLLKKAVEEKTAPQVKDDTPEEVRPEEGIKIKQIKGGKVGIGGNLALASGKLKVVLLSVLLVAAVAFMLGSLGVVDFGQLLGLSESAKSASGKTGVAKRPIARKSIPVAPQSTQKTTNNKASNKAAAPETKRFVGIPSGGTLAKARRRVIDRINRRTKPVSSTEKPIIVQEDPKPSPSTEKPVIAGQLPEPMASTQKELVQRQPAEPVTTQEPPVTKTSAEPVGPTPKPLVAQEPLEPSPQEVQPDVVEAACGSAEQIPEKPALARENVSPGERDLSYPYSIYLGSYKTRERAESAISEYRNKGLSPYWAKVDLGDRGVWYRIFSGYFQTREQANEFIKEKQIAGPESRHTRYANLIGLFAVQKEVDEEKLRLSKLGYCPYVIPGQNGASLLYVGAFYQKARAERQHAELASKGIHSQIVER